MTREEAIWWVNHLFEIRKEEYFNKSMMEDAKEVEQAQHMAIEALQFVKHFDLLKEYQSLQYVVRCKDCEYKRLYDDGDTKYYYCALEDRPNRQWSVDDTDFCSWAERREP